MDTFFLHICIRHTESLGDLNTCWAAVNKAIQLWTDAISWLTGSLRLFPRVSSYNQSMDNMWLCSQTIQHEINLVEKQYLNKRKAKAENAAETKAAWKERVWEQVSQAIHQYMQAAGWAILISLGPHGDHGPWLAQITARACDFHSQIMSAVADYSDIPMELWCAAVLQQLDMFHSTAHTLPWTCPLSYPIPAQFIHPEAKVPPMPTSSKGSPKPSNSSQPSGSDIWSSGAGEAVAHSAPGVRQPTGTGLLAAWVSTSQIQITPALSQGSSYGCSRGQPISESSLLVPIEAMSFGAPLSQPYNLYSSLPQMSMRSSQEVPVSRPIRLMTPAPALHSQDQGSTLAPIFQQHAPASTAQQPTEDGDIIFMGITHDDDDNIKEVSLVDKSPMVPEKCQWVVQNITQNITQSASKVSEVAVFDAMELDLIQSCLGKPITLTDTEDCPVKAPLNGRRSTAQKSRTRAGTGDKKHRQSLTPWLTILHPIPPRPNQIVAPIFETQSRNRLSLSLSIRGVMPLIISLSMTSVTN